MLQARKQAWLWIVGLLIAVSIGLGWIVWSDNIQSVKSFERLKRVTLGVEMSLPPASVWVAESKNYFQEEGLDLKIVGFDSGRLSFVNMLKGGVDISTAAPTPIMFNSFKQDDFCIFATMSYSDDDIKVIARMDHGIRKFGDIRGKRVGTPAGTTGQFYLSALLASKEIPSSEISEISASPSKLPETLQSGHIDAIVIWEPHASKARELLGEKAIWLPSSDVYRTKFNFLVSKAFAKNNPKILEAFVRALDRATNFIAEHKKEAQAIVSNRLQLDLVKMGILWDDFVFKIYLDKSLLVTLEDEARWAIANKLTDKEDVPNYLNYICPNALKAVKPNAVTMIN